MSVAVEAEVRRVIGPAREARLSKAFELAWNDWWTCPDRAKYSLWPRTRANMVFERLAYHLQQEFVDDIGVRFFFHDETIKVVFDDQVLARCKKANDQGFGQNVQTQANLAFCGSEAELPGIPGLQKIEILYFVNQMGTEINSLLVQARDGDMRLWAYPLGSTGVGSATGDDIPRIPEPSAPPPFDASDLVNPKRKPQERRDEETDE